jgi:glycosyltransferase involved in cell wall biosynthesis
VSDPVVSVVTPVHNTARYLRECIESVLTQTYAALEYLIIDNWSTDGSGEIAQEYAARDARIRVVRPPAFLPQVANLNFGLRAINERARYCKLVMADDWLFAQCLEQMVDVAERHPGVGLVGAYYLKGIDVLGTGLPYGPDSFPGRDVCRAQLLEGRFFFGSTSSVMYRADLVRARDPFFDVDTLHSDTEACYRILQTADFGFVHQVLSFLRVDESSISGRYLDFNPHLLDKLIVLMKFGPSFLSSDEYRATLGGVKRRYWRYLGLQGLRSRPAGFWEYHARGLATVGEQLPRGRLMRYRFAALGDLLLHPMETLADLRRLVAQ